MLHLTAGETMKLVMTLLVRDEEDIIDATIRFHLDQGVDFVIATDNRSVDATPEILRDHERAGHLLYLREDEDDYSQARWVTRMARRAATEHQADWVINNDADELWWPLEGDLKSTLAAVPEGVCVLEAQRYNLIPRPDVEGHAFSRMQIRESVSHNVFGRRLPPKVCHRADPDITVMPGNHAVGGSATGAIVHPAQMMIFHYPLRTYAQFEHKIIVGGQAYARNTEVAPNVGRTWRNLYSEYLGGRLPDHWAASVLDEERIKVGLANGSLVKDTRIADFFQRSNEAHRSRAQVVDVP